MTRHATPDAAGHFGPYGGRFVPETLMEPLRELEAAYAAGARATRPSAPSSPRVLRDFVGRPTPLTVAGAALRAPRLPRLPEARGPVPHRRPQDQQRAGPGAARAAHGQEARGGGDGRRPARRGHRHRVRARSASSASSTWAPTTWRARPRTCAACGCSARRCAAVDSGARTLKDAINEAMRDWVTNVRTTHYLLGSVLGAHPYPMMVRDFQSVIGEEARAQVLEQAGALPDLLVACVGGGSNAIGLFHAFLDDPVAMVGVEAGGRSAARRAITPRGSSARGAAVGRAARHAHLPPAGRGGQRPAHALGLRGPRLSGGRARARAAARPGPRPLRRRHATRRRWPPSTCSRRREGIIPALESSHALAWVVREARRAGSGKRVLVNLSGRGDKDLASSAGRRDDAGMRDDSASRGASRR